MSTVSIPLPAVLDDLLAARRPGDAVFSSPRGVLSARGARAELVPRAGDDVAGLVADLLRAHGPDAMVLGALPFAPGGGGRLVVPEHVRRGPASAADAGPAAPGPPTAGWSVRPVPAAADYAAAVDRAVARMAADPGRLRKVVLARALDLTADAPVDASAILRRLAARDPRGYAFAVDLGGGATLVGASPELLVARRGTRVVAQPLAGSAARRSDPGEDHEAAAALFRSAKDRREHALVVDAVADGLRPLCRTLEVPEAPQLVATGAMWHLGTTVVGELADPATTALELAAALHPTPAVCGTPPDAARALIAELEPFERGPYAGTVGWQDATGDGEWVVTIRCGVVRDRSLRVFAGAGVVPGSRGEDELAETAAKLRTFLSAVGVQEQR
jgi:isochorismate synthase